jgi:hypothetical protein
MSKFDKFAEISLEDLELVTGGRVGAQTAMEIKRRQDAESEQIEDAMRGGPAGLRNNRLGNRR